MKHKFCFRFSFFFAAKKRNWTSIFVFHFFPAGKETKFEFTLCSPFFLFVTFDLTDFNFLFRFSFSYGILKTDHDSFLVFCFRLMALETKIAALENVLDKDFVRRFLIEQKHTYEEPVTEIKARYPNLKGCKLHFFIFYVEDYRFS